MRMHRHSRLYGLNVPDSQVKSSIYDRYLHLANKCINLVHCLISIYEYTDLKDVFLNVLKLQKSRSTAKMADVLF